MTQIKEINLLSMKKLDQLLKHLGSGIATSPKLYIKICRIIKHVQKIEKNQEIKEKFDKDTLLIMEKIIKKRLLPAMSYYSSKPGISENLWSIFENF